MFIDGRNFEFMPNISGFSKIHLKHLILLCVIKSSPQRVNNYINLIIQYINFK